MAKPFENTLFLNEDALTQLLVRTSASDHGALRCVCRTFNRILNSSSFRRERMLTEWAEVDAKVLSGRELFEEQQKYNEYDDNTTTFSTDSCYTEMGYKKEYGDLVIENEYNIFVDGKKAGGGSFLLFSRRNKIFHELVDSVSSETQYIGCTYFDNKGRVRPASVKQEMKENGDPKTSFLHIKSLRMAEDYRQHSWVGARALRMIMMEGMLKNMWSIAVYIADYRSQFVGNDEDKDDVVDMKRRDRQYHSESKNKEPDEEEVQWYKCIQELRLIDLRSFIRAGFKQAKEMVKDSTCYHVYVLPKDMEHPMIPHEEALSYTVKAPKTISGPTGSNAELLSYMKEVCSGHAYRMQLIDENEKLLAEKEAECTAFIAVTIAQLREASTETAVIDEFAREIETKMRELIEPLKVQIKELKEQDDSNEMREKVLTFINETGASIRKSNAIHACAARKNLRFIETLLDLLPSELERQQAINDFDENGATPLMVAAASIETRGNLQFLEDLLELGANKNTVSEDGETALGIFRGAQQSKNDVGNAFGLNQPDDASLMLNEDVERILRPANGPTAADDAILDSEDDSDDLSEDMDDDEDFDMLDEEESF